MDQMNSAPGAQAVINGREVDYFCGTGLHPASGFTFD